MVVAVIALIVALAGTAYAAQSINSGTIQKQSIGAGRLRQKTLTGYQINADKLGVVPTAKRAAHAYWAVVDNPAGAEQRETRPRQRRSHHRDRGRRSSRVDLPGQRQRLRQRRRPRQRRHRRCPAPATPRPTPRPPTPTRSKSTPADKNGANEDADFHLIVVCP